MTLLATRIDSLYFILFSETDDESKTGGGPIHTLIQATSSLSLNSQEARDAGLRSRSTSLSSSDLEDLVAGARQKEVEEEANEEQEMRANGDTKGNGDESHKGDDDAEKKKKEAKETEGKLEAMEDAAK